jgi:hypothetical protein
VTTDGASDTTKKSTFPALPNTLTGSTANSLVGQSYCPSGFSELRPALRISSVDRRFIAITEMLRDEEMKYIMEANDLP